MRSIRQLAWLRGIAACALVSVHCGGDRAGYVAECVLAEPLMRASITLNGHASLSIETRAVTAAARPVLHLWDDAARVEVAHAEGSFWQRDVRLTFRNPDPGARVYTLFMRASDRAHRGRADVYRDGHLLARAAAVSGSFLRLQREPGLVYRVAATPGGPHAALLIGLGRTGEMLAIDQRSGPTGLPSLPSRDGIEQLLLLPLTAAGRFSVYANDAVDRDGDGLGRHLERALGTCDSPSDRACRRSPLAAYYARVANATRDSDRDGLADADELFGVDATALDLPRYGADPRHKDALVEIDHHPSLDAIGFSEDELARIAALFAQGSASDLKNPDGRTGLAVHFDAGFPPRDPAHVALFGDFGGSGRARETDYRSARRSDFSQRRAGYFRYAFSTRKGRGQTTGDAFTVNRDLVERVTVFAHELGHALGLSHAGSAEWGRANCKPNYFSIMNYLYQNRYEVGFSRHATRALHPDGVFERAGRPAFARAEWLQQPPLELDVFGRDVDWNRDGIISDVAVRADLVWATYKSCGAAEHGQSTLSDRELGAATPLLGRIGDHLNALWLSDRGSLRARRLRVRGECGDDCRTWTPTETLAGLDGLRFIAGLELSDERFGLAYARQSGAIGLATLQLTAAGLALASDVALPGRTEHNPSLVAMAVDPQYYGASELLSVLFRASDGALWQASARDPSGPFVLRRVLDGQARPIESAFGPSAIALPTEERCGAFSDRDGFVRFYCYEPKRDRWVDLSARAFDVGLGPKTSASPSLAYHRYRDAAGSAIDRDPTRGALYLSFSEPIGSADYPANPQFLVSEWLSRRHGAVEQISLRWRGRVINEWTHLAPETAVALYEDGSEPDLQALLLVRNDSADSTHLDFLPHADGVFDESLAGGNDFRVMERGVCLGLHSEQTCGDASTD